MYRKNNIIICLVVALLSLSSCVQKDGEEKSVTTSGDLSVHPVYSKYEFGHDDKTIDFGSQPLAVPVGAIGELMSRDMVLRDELAKRGMNIRFHSFFKGADINYFLKRDDLEVAIGGDMPVINAAASCKTVVPSLAKQQFSSIVARKMMLMKDLKGKRVGNAFGSSAHYSLIEALSSAGLSEKDLIMVRMKVSEMPEALAKGEIDAFSAWEPTPTIALTKYDDMVVIHKNLNTSYLYMSLDFADKYSDEAAHIVASQVRAMRWMRESEEALFTASKLQINAAADFSGKEPVLTIEKNAELITSGLLSITSAPFIPQDYYSRGGRLEGEFELLKEIGKIGAEVDWDTVEKSFDRTILEKILSDPDRFRVNEFRYLVD